MGETTISITFDPYRLSSCEGSHLAMLWHVAQANPAPIDDRDAGEVAERIGREIIRRWLGTIPPELWRHQGRHHYWDHLRRLGKWSNGEFVPHSGQADAPPTTEED